MNYMAREESWRTARVWLMYQNPAQWKAYTRERNRFNTMLKYKKHHSFHTLILQSKHDTKKLYKIIKEIIELFFYTSIKLQQC